MATNKCPHCGTRNIPGDETCADCGQPLDDKHLPPPETAVERSLLSDRIGELSPKPPIAVAPATAVGDVVRLMAARGVGCVVVAEANQAVGIFSEQDALRKLGVKFAELAARPVSDFMTPKPRTLVDSAKIAFAVQRMDLGGFRHLPIVDKNGELVGVISARDILKHLTAKMVEKD